MLTVGLIGARRGMSLAATFALDPDCRLVSVLDTDAARRAAFTDRYSGAQAYTTLESFLSHPPDVVIVASPPHLHRDHTVASLEAGSHVLQEVFLAATIEQCQDIVDAVKAHPRQKFMLAENCCYWAHMLSWKRMFSDGRIGKLMYAEAEYVHDVRSLWTDSAGGPTWRATLPPLHYCSHSLGPILMVTGERCLSVTALAVGPYLSSEPGHLDLESALLRTESGAAIKVLTAFGVVREPSFHYYSLYGTEGTLETARPPARLATHAYMEGVEHLHGMMTMPLNYDMPGAPAAALTGGHGTAEYFMVQDYLNCIRNDSPPPTGIAKALDMCVPGLVAHQSAINGGTPMSIPELI